MNFEGIGPFEPSQGALHSSKIVDVIVIKFWIEVLAVSS
jgi:hypothetical protein